MITKKYCQLSSLSSLSQSKRLAKSCFLCGFRFRCHCQHNISQGRFPVINITAHTSFVESETLHFSHNKTPWGLLLLTGSTSSGVSRKCTASYHIRHISQLRAAITAFSVNPYSGILLTTTHSLWPVDPSSKDSQCPSFRAVDDRVRGGSSQSHLTVSASGHTASFNRSEERRVGKECPV